jgi:alpha-beta hydrolase superfamily lysophospholipase
MIPFSFNGLAARLHRPDAAKASGVGVVIVPPHGLEALAAAKTLRLLAERLAAGGHASLRYDLPGTGDSLGSDADPDRIQAWLASITAAAAQLRAHAGVTQIVLLGLRFGALLAAAAAGTLDEIGALVLLDPVTQGGLYARELAMTARAVAEGASLDPEQTSTADGVVIGGLLTSRATLAAMRPLRLSTAPLPPATLLLHRSGARDLPATVTAEPADGFERIGLSPTMAETPHPVLDRVADFLATLPAGPLQPMQPPAPARLATDRFVEQQLRFGPDDRLYGVLCEQAPSGAAAPVVIILNAGRNPHTGWARSHVTLARRLATMGVASLRLDLSGIGEGLDRPGVADHVDELLYADSHDAECRAAVDLVIARGFGPVTVLGACSGAYLALRSVAHDARVSGAVMVNLQRFIWRAGESVSFAIANSYPVGSSYMGKLIDPAVWKRVLTGQRRVWPLLRALARRVTRRVMPDEVASAETTKARALMQAITTRGARTDFIYAETDAGLVELAHHFGPRGRDLAEAPGVHFHFLPDCDHDLTPVPAREQLFAILQVAVAPHPAPTVPQLPRAASELAKT